MNTKINFLAGCWVTNTAKACIAEEVLTLQRSQLYDQEKEIQPKPEIILDLT